MSDEWPYSDENDAAWDNRVKGLTRSITAAVNELVDRGGRCVDWETDVRPNGLGDIDAEALVVGAVAAAYGPDHGHLALVAEALGETVDRWRSIEEQRIRARIRDLERRVDEMSAA